jgi:hypothetical protein
MLEMGKPRHDRFGMLTGKGDEHLPQLTEDYQLLEDILAESYPEAGTDFIIPRSPDMESSTGLLPCRTNKIGFKAGVDILELIVKYLLGNPVVIELEQRRKERAGSLLSDDPLFVQHHDMGNINEDVRICEVPVCLHRREKVHHLP